ncbi:MAG: hypothetical protein AAF938_16800 [Myxococcota bacterium]
MKSTLPLALLAALALIAPIDPPPTEACGWYPTGQETSEEYSPAMHSLMTAPHLPLLSPGWHSEYWLIAWARLQGKRFSDEEVASLSGSSNWLTPDDPWGADDALQQWRAARSLHAPRGQRTPRVPVFDRSADYRSVRIIAADAFRTAADSLQQRATSRSAEEVVRWLDAQDRVFGRAEHQPSAVPTESAFEAYDRAYQQAVWLEYRGAHELARQAYAAIDAASQWFEVANYRALRLGVLHGPTPTPDAIRSARAAAQTPKMRRALRQILDRATLFTQLPERIVTELAARIVQEDLGADLPRTLRDLVHFAKRVRDPDCRRAPLNLIACQTGGRVPPSSLAALRRQERVPSSSGRSLLAINRAFHDGQRALEAGRRSDATASARRLARLARTSTASTRNAAGALQLATARGNARIDHLLRERADGHSSLHADGADYLRSLDVRGLVRARTRVPALAGSIDAVMLVRLAGRGEWDALARVARRLAGGEGEFASALTAALSQRGRERNVALAIALAQHQPGDFAVADEFARFPCGLGTCDDHHPNDNAVTSLVRGARTTRGWARARLEAFGEEVIRLTRGHDDEASAELLHRWVRLTRRASLNGTASDRTGALSRRAFIELRERFNDSIWTARTPHWYQ